MVRMPRTATGIDFFAAALVEGFVDEFLNDVITLKAIGRRYRWHGEVSRSELKRRLATCWLMVLSSKMEGGANVLSEAIVHYTPVLASRIPGSIGLLGDDYEGYYDFADTRQLRELLIRCEQEPTVYHRLQQQVANRAPLFTPEAEKLAWKKLLSEL